MPLTEGQRKILEKKRNEAKGKSAQADSRSPETSTPQELREGLPLDAIEQVSQHHSESDGKVADRIMLTRQASDQESFSLEENAEEFAKMAGFRDALTILSVRGKKKSYTAHFLDQFNSLQVNTNFGFTEIDDLEAQIAEFLTPKPTLFKPSSRQLAYQEELASLPESTSTDKTVED
jgi:hypothetical protein